MTDKQKTIIIKDPPLAWSLRVDEFSSPPSKKEVKKCIERITQKRQKTSVLNRNECQSCQNNTKKEDDYRGSCPKLKEYPRFTGCKNYEKRKVSNV